MSDTPADTPTSRKTRNSLSCTQCRYKHVRCDGHRPVCSRCATNAIQCVYAASRRRGNPKAKRILLSPTTTVNASSLHSSLPTSTTSSASSITISRDVDPSSNSASQFLNLYYEFFHAAHPCILPLQVLKDRLTETQLQPLIQVICYVGSVFDNSHPQLSESLAQQAHESVAEIRAQTRRLNPFDVQALLLYSIAIYWCNKTQNGVELLDEAIRMAVALGMNKKEFAQTYGEADPVVEESWRRTWWVIYITDAHIAGMKLEPEFGLGYIADYYRINAYTIPSPKSLDDYENREFLGEDETEFSSYAQLIGLTVGIDRALAPGNTTDYHLYARMAANSDTSILAWFSLLPPGKRQLVRPDGSFDEVMFKALFIMHTYTVEIHRPLSGLTHSAIESVSRCAPLAPSDQLNCNNAHERDLHTARCTQAINSIDELLTLPTDMNMHSPFIICMIANVTIAHLSACRFIFSGDRRAASREKIRLTMGTLKRLSEHWTLGKRTYREIGTIARELLSLAKDPATSSATVTTIDTIDLPLSDSQSLALPGFDMLTDGDFDFSAFLNSGTTGITEARSVFL
ncbi:hypothetical protein N7457_008601 [Penicillium paradoxum]|uniref:uncharacterized protein n=1 Tax=Penicillium paradoxum TaxID=176176 RepID=UPI002548540E|nr:uncharacterized protein N7457_008601 [Penicillium paradoxum]KAJ5773705.1 hypothetical protein N7457_008601 [Penicillium paradoxum]